MQIANLSVKKTLSLTLILTESGVTLKINFVGKMFSISNNFAKPFSTTIIMYM